MGSKWWRVLWCNEWGASGGVGCGVMNGGASGGVGCGVMNGGASGGVCCGVMNGEQVVAWVVV